MGKIIAVIVPTVIWLLCVFCLVRCFNDSPNGIEGDYSAKVEVAKPDEIENTISNVVSDVRKRDFVLIGVSVVWVPVRSCYSVEATGITRDKLINHKP